MCAREGLLSTLVSRVTPELSPDRCGGSWQVWSRCHCQGQVPRTGSRKGTNSRAGERTWAAGRLEAAPRRSGLIPGCHGGRRAARPRGPVPQLLEGRQGLHGGEPGASEIRLSISLCRQWGHRGCWARMRSKRRLGGGAGSVHPRARRRRVREALPHGGPGRGRSRCHGAASSFGH